MDIKRKYLSSVFSYLYKHKKIADNPMSIVEPVKYKKMYQSFSQRRGN